MVEVSTKEVKKGGRRIGSKNIANPDKQPRTRLAYQLKEKVLITERGMANDSVVKFNLPQAIASQMFAGAVDVEKSYKIGKMISVKSSRSGRLECTLRSMNGTLIGFVLVAHLMLQTEI